MSASPTSERNVVQRWLSEAEFAMQTGELKAALAAYSRALELKPDLADAWFNSGWLQKQLGNEDRALVAYAHAIAHGVDRPEEAHLNRAAIYSEHFRDTAMAVQELHAALEIHPSFIPGLHSLGVLQEDQGLLEAAAATYERALHQDGGDARSHARLANLQIARGDAVAAIISLERILPSIQSPADRAELLFALGNAFDFAGEDDRAFQAIEAANWLAKTSASLRYDRVAQERLVDRLIALKTPAPLSGLPAHRLAPIFICGMFRSGSTLADAILGRHYRVHSGGELPYFPRLIATKLQPYPQGVNGLSASDRISIRKDYADYISSLCPDRGFITDKRCDNFLALGLIRSIYPDADIIHTYRQPLDNILSIYFLYFDVGLAYGFDLSDIAHYYVQYRRLIAHWTQVYPSSLHHLDYDSVVTQPKREIQSMLRYLDLDWDEACLNSLPGGEPVRTPSSWQVRQPLHQRSSGRWRRYERQLKPAIDILQAAGTEC